MTSSELSKKSVDKFINIDKERKTNKKDNLNNNIDEKNLIKELINEGVISLEKKEEQNEDVFDINNIKDMNYEKMFKKIIDLNRALKSLQIDKYRLSNEKNMFVNGFNENVQKRNDLDKDLNFMKNYNYSNDDNLSDNRKYLCITYNKEKLLKQYEEDLNFFNELLLEFNNEN